jgi:cytochrome P450
MTIAAAAQGFTPPTITPPQRPLPFLRRVRTLIDNPIEAWPQAVYEEPIFAPKPPWGPRLVLVTDPGAIRQILLDDVEAFPKGELFTRFLRPALGDAILTAEGEHWRWQRRAAAPAFRPDRIAAFVPMMRRAAEASVVRLRAVAEGARIDVAGEMTRITFDVILETMLSGGEGFDAEAVGRDIALYLETMGRPSIADLLGLPRALRRLLRTRGVQAAGSLRASVETVIARRALEEPRNDLLDLLRGAVDPETGRAMSPADLRDNLLTFIAAGHETTALALTWTLYLLGRDHETAARVRAEIASVAGDAPIDALHADKLVFTRQAVLESMRLYPPVAAVPRQAARTVEVLGLPFAPGTFFLVPIYALHRHRRLWDAPDAFAPDRFAPEHGLEKKRFQYMPFGAGPRICIGMGFALTEAVVILATLMRALSFAPDPSHPIRPKSRITLRPEGGMPMFVGRAG